MNADLALRILQRETGRRTQAELAQDVGVSEGTISRWLSAKSPPKRGLSVLVTWAERQPSYAVPSATAVRVREVAPNAKPLAELRGQARAVLSMLQAVIAEQQQLVEGLEPWSFIDDALSAERGLSGNDPSVGFLTPNATPEELEAATARQLRLDAEEARARAREA
jgi:transcriptional regulator with XRE-family HTH domain